MTDFLIFIIGFLAVLFVMMYRLWPGKKFFRWLRSDRLLSIQLFVITAGFILCLLISLAAVAFGIAMFVKSVMFSL